MWVSGKHRDKVQNIWLWEWHSLLGINKDVNSYGRVLSYLKCQLSTRQVEVEVSHTRTIYFETFENKLQTI